jgi:hypothetical protein
MTRNLAERILTVRNLTREQKCALRCSTIDDAKKRLKGRLASSKDRRRERSHHQGEAFRNDGCCSFEGHEARIDCTKDRSWVGFSVPFTCDRPARKTGFGLSSETKDYFRSWMLLASAPKLSESFDAQDAGRFLARKARFQRCTRQPDRICACRTRLERLDSLGVRVEGSSETSGPTESLSWVTVEKSGGPARVAVPGTPKFNLSDSRQYVGQFKLKNMRI